MQKIFNNKQLFELAMTHPSCASKRGGVNINNQRLEFLGDSVLGMLIAEMLYKLYPDEQEGELARRFSGLVNGEVLANVARKLGFGEMIKMASSEIDGGGRDNNSNLEDSVEAIIGALYLDGGIEKARDFVTEHWLELAQSLTEAPKDAKTSLQEWAQGRGLPLPEYNLVSQTGSAHAPEFVIEVSVKNNGAARATAPSKKQAQMEAAKNLLEKLTR
jgi:ribonuclease III